MKIAALIGWPPSLDRVLVDAQRVIARLDAAIEHHFEQHEWAEARRQDAIAQAASHAAERDTHEAAAKRAERIRDRLAELLA